MGNSVRLALVVMVLGVMAVGGCASADEPASTESVVTDDSAIGTCPATADARKQRQRQAGLVLRYLLGGPAEGGWTSNCPGLLAQATSWRNVIVGGGLRGMTTLPPTTVCGRTAVPIKFDFWVEDGTDCPMCTMIAKMKACFGDGVEPFAHVSGSGHACADNECQTFFATMTMDPEPAAINDGWWLGTWDAATAAAHGVNSNEGTTAVRFASTYLNAANRNDFVGRPCVRGTQSAGPGSVWSSFVAYANPPSNTWLRCM